MVGRGWRDSNPQSRSGACLKDRPLCPFAYTPSSGARGETRTLNLRGLSPPPLPRWATRACGMRAAGVEPAPRLFLREPPLPFGPRARRRLEIGTGGEIRTHKSRLLRTVCLPFAPLPHVMLEGGVEPPNGHKALGALDAARLPFTPPQPVISNSASELRGEDSNPHSLFQRQASCL